MIGGTYESNGLGFAGFFDEGRNKFLRFGVAVDVFGFELFELFQAFGGNGIVFINF